MQATDGPATPSTISSLRAMFRYSVSISRGFRRRLPGPAPNWQSGRLRGRTGNRCIRRGTIKALEYGRHSNGIFSRRRKPTSLIGSVRYAPASVTSPPPSLMLYATGGPWMGPAWSPKRTSRTAKLTPPTQRTVTPNWPFGWVAGAGVEHRPWRHQTGFARPRNICTTTLARAAALLRIYPWVSPAPISTSGHRTTGRGADRASVTN